MRSRNTRFAGGFTLLEVMAALVIFLTGVVFVLALFVSGLAQHRSATQRAIIAQASEIVREEVDAMLLEHSDPSGPSDPNSPPAIDLLDPSSGLPAPQHVPVDEYPGCFYSVESIQVDPDQGPEGGVMLTVFVYTVDAGRKRGERFTLFSRPANEPERLIRRARDEKVATGRLLKSTEESGQ